MDLNNSNLNHVGFTFVFTISYEIFNSRSNFHSHELDKSYQRKTERDEMIEME